MTESDVPRDQEYGELERGPDGVTLRFTRHLPHPPEKVWRALTEEQHLAAWMPTTIEGDLTVAGAALRFAFRHVPVAPMDGHAIACDPPKQLEYQWGDERLRFELTPRESGTLLVFTASFAAVGKAARDAAGWHVCLDELRSGLDGRPAPFTTDDRWRLVNPEYAARFGPEAATEGPPKEWEDTYGSP
jgi:uncharacterized protein YndB with AHSA1/START domain